MLGLGLGLVGLWLGLVGLVGLGLGLGLGLAIQASRVFLPRLAIHTATGKASRVYSISHKLRGDSPHFSPHFTRRHFPASRTPHPAFYTTPPIHTDSRVYTISHS